MCHLFAVLHFTCALLQNSSKCNNFVLLMTCTILCYFETKLNVLFVSLYYTILYFQMFDTVISILQVHMKTLCRSHFSTVHRKVILFCECLWLHFPNFSVKYVLQLQQFKGRIQMASSLCLGADIRRPSSCECNWKEFCAPCDYE